MWNSGADNDPKTSEYAFFKKLKKDAGLRFHSRPLQKDDSQPKKTIPSEYCRGWLKEMRMCFDRFY